MTLAQIQCEEDRTFQKGVSILDAAGGLKLKQYVDEAPSAQNLIDLIPGWICRLPSSVPVTAGALELFADGRVDWAVSLLGGVDGKSIIELGPLEGGHTYMLLNAGAADVTAVEANSFGFLKCLIVKELLNLQRASFLLGNFVPWLAQGDKHADIVWASGVLYHMTDPVDLLESLSRVADTVYLWTHYVSDEEMPHGDPRRTLITETLEVPWHEHALRLYRRPYLGADFPGFMGGVHPDPMWMERDHILLVLNTLGFNRIDILPGDPAHPQGPNFALLARRTRRGFLDGVGLRTLYGWATDDHGPPPELTASVNGVARLVFTPSLERPDLLPFLGRSDLGFAPDLGIPLKIGDWVAVSTADGWQPRGSPMQITWLDGSREDKALALVNREMTILEIGPSFKPIACRSAGWHSYSLDHASQEELREKYRGSQPIENIEPVDFIWQSGALEGAVPQELHGTFDAVIASHVVEHFPDPIGFYLSAAKLLKDGGLVSLVVPDKRFTFDFFKPVSATSDLLNAHAQGRTRHSKKTAFDNLAYNVFEHGNMSWSVRLLNEFSFPGGNTALRQAMEIFDSTVEDESVPYVDFHHTVYTPSSFALNILELSQLGVIPYIIAQSYPTSDCEFYVTLRKGPVEILAPDELTAERIRLLREIIREQAEQARWMDP